jgi:sugar O-acyltransferase (sialic acid O-acetyltransferase NeuD family)
MTNSRNWVSPSKCKSLVLFGTGDFAKIAHEYFEGDSGYRVVGFTVNQDYITDKEFCGLPVVPFEEVETYFPPETHSMYVCVVYFNMNRDRAKIYKEAKDKRYELASYVSSYAFVSPNAKLGEHCFVFEGNVIQTDVVIEDNVILWSSNHIGHGSRIEKDNFISSHVVISGHCSIGSNCFLGVNSTLANGTTLGRESWVMHGAIVSGNVPANSMVRTAPSEVMPLNEQALSRALERARK